MPLFEWNPYFETGIKEIDLQHKKLVILANRLHSEYMKGLHYEIRPRSILSDIIDELYDYTQLHFMYEEKWMKKMNYPDIKTHKEKHDALILTLDQFRLDFDEGKLNAEDLADFVFLWLTKHILGEDKKYISHLNPSPKNSDV